MVRAADEDSTQRKNSKELTNIASSVTPIITAFPPELQKIINQWENLPEHIRQTIRMLATDHRGLSRFGGLRCPSEVLRLKWTDVDFEHLRFTVHVSKTEHHADGGIRTVPMFPELKALFQDAFDKAPEGAVYCINKYKGLWSNLGTGMIQIVKNAELTPWPKIFQNCRSTRETELFKMTDGNVKAVCEWIGKALKWQ